MKVGEAVAKVLEEQGAKVVFGIPGGQTLFFVDPLMNSNIKFIQTRHENGAAGAADAWGRLTGKPGLCSATTGPGATNLLTAIGGAYRDSSPVIIYLFQNRTADIGRGAAQEADHQNLFENLVKAYIPVRTASVAVWAMREAYRKAMTGKPGPVVVDFYRDVIEEGECDYTPMPVEEYCCLNSSAPSAEQLCKAAGLIDSYKKIAIWSGNGVKMTHSGDKVMELAEKLNAPVITTFNGMSSVPSEHPLVFGPRSRHGNQVARAILEEADCVLVLGSSMSMITTNGWSIKIKKVIQVDLEASQIGRFYPAACGIVGDIPKTLDVLVPAVADGSAVPERAAWVADLTARFEAQTEKVFSGPIGDADATPTPPMALMRALNGLLKDDQVICVDAGNPGAWSHHLNYKPTMAYMKPVNFGNMGFAIPAAIGCSIAEPEREVICILGDGSLGMTLGDIDTLARFGKKVIVILHNDSAFGNIKQEQLYKFGEGHYSGVELSSIDYAAVAKTLGMDGETIKTANELAGAFERARAAERPYFINVIFDGSFTVWPEIY